MTKKMIPTDTIPLNINDIWDVDTVGGLQRTLLALHDHLNSYDPKDEVCNNDSDYNPDLCIQKYREETDSEYNYRLAKEKANELRNAEAKAKQKAKIEEKERKILEKLKKKYKEAG